MAMVPPVDGGVVMPSWTPRLYQADDVYRLKLFIQRHKDARVLLEVATQALIPTVVNVYDHARLEMRQHEDDDMELWMQCFTVQAWANSWCSVCAQGQQPPVGATGADVMLPL
jgi:hypothetical protein